jgi:hypothetical protein
MTESKLDSSSTSTPFSSFGVENSALAATTNRLKTTEKILIFLLCFDAEERTTTTTTTIHAFSPLLFEGSNLGFVREHEIT